MAKKNTTKNYKTLSKVQLIQELEREDSRYGVTKSDIIGMIERAYLMGRREKKCMDAAYRAEWVYDVFMNEQFGNGLKEPSYYNREEELPF